MGGVVWWSIEFISGLSGLAYMKLENGVNQNLFTLDGQIISQDQPLEYYTVETNVPAPSWYDPLTNKP